MNIKRLFYLAKINIAKVVMVSCVFFFAFLITGFKVSAAREVVVTSSTYYGNGKSDDKVLINGIPYIQGTGISNKDGITFEINDIHGGFNDGVGFRAMAVWESGFSSGLARADYDRWYVQSVEYGDDLGYNEIITNLNKRSDVAKDGNDNVIVYRDTRNSKVWYIQRENEYYKEGDSNTQATIVDFTNFFVNKKITYTYRIRNSNAYYQGDGFGYKRIYINFWNSTNVNDNPIHPDPLVIEYGLVKPISDVEVYTNSSDAHSNSNPVACSNYQDYICVDYVDTLGSSATIRPKTYNVYLPTNVLYTHSSTSNLDVLTNGMDNGSVNLTYVQNNNSLYAYNYFCESGQLIPATITYSNGVHSATCSDGSTARKYVYVEANYPDVIEVTQGENTIEVPNDASRITVKASNFNSVYQSTEFRSEPYKIEMTADSRGNYVIIVKDCFGNKNEKAVVKVMDILNQAILVTFDKSNKSDNLVEAANGWKAKENYSNGDVIVTLTMTATTIIEKGFPIVEATTTNLDKTRVKLIKYWRVPGANTVSDVCLGDDGGEDAECAAMPTSASLVYTLYSSQSSTDTNPTLHSSFNDFSENQVQVKIHENGRYRFYIELFTTEGKANNTASGKGEQKNPRVEMYKLDNAAPEIVFFNDDSTSRCDGDDCKYQEETFAYYQGSGNPSGTVINNTYADGSEIQIDYATKTIYYISANGKQSILGSAVGSSDTQDTFFTYMHALFNSGVYIRENIVYYGNVDSEEYSYFKASSLTTVTNAKTSFATTLNSKLTSTNEDTYREYIIANDIRYTAYNLATTLNTTVAGTNVHNVKIEYMDAVSTSTTVCEALSANQKIDFNNDGNKDQEDCVNFYLDHAKDFYIKISVYDLVQDDSGNYVIGNLATRSIKVEVKDTTAPGFNKEINRYNIGSSCRMELGNIIGLNSYQTESKLLECYGIKTEGSTPTYNFEDNKFDATLNVKLYILSLESKQWEAVSEGYVPNRSGKYALLIVLSDGASGVVGNLQFNNSHTYHNVTMGTQTIQVSGNSIATVVSYYSSN